MILSSFFTPITFVSVKLKQYLTLKQHENIKVVFAYNKMN